ncbi:MAG: cell division topological specificity factor MinE [Anaerolineae bacterium]|nr:cell division topological specificity factor MinE [Anaerolineae bacterium]
MDKLTSRKPKSAEAAKERLKLVLIHDRMDITQVELESMKNEIIEVISRYVVIDQDAVRISMNQDGRENRLVADIPIRSKSHSRTR